MNLTEHQSKNILRSAGVRVPAGGLSKSLEESVAIAQSLPQSEWVVKAQIRAGGDRKGISKTIVSPVAAFDLCPAQRKSKPVPHRCSTMY